MLSHQIISAHPSPLVHNEVLAECINACFDCVHACTSCADACLAEDEVDSLRHCIQIDNDCADVCTATAGILARQTAANMGLLTTQLKCCRHVCDLCAQECESHRHHRHCAICAETCRTCAETCRELLKVVNEQPQS